MRLAKYGGRALALDGVPYQNDAMFGRHFTDVYKVDLASGERTRVAKHLIPPVDFSPGGRYAMNFQDGHFWVYDLETGASARHQQRRAGEVRQQGERLSGEPEAGLWNRRLDQERPQRDRV